MFTQNKVIVEEFDSVTNIYQVVFGKKIGFKK